METEYHKNSIMRIILLKQNIIKLEYHKNSVMRIILKQNIIKLKYYKIEHYKNEIL